MSCATNCPKTVNHAGIRGFSSAASTTESMASMSEADRPSPRRVLRPPRTPEGRETSGHICPKRRLGVLELGVHDATVGARFDALYHRNLLAFLTCEAGFTLHRTNAPYTV